MNKTFCTNLVNHTGIMFLAIFNYQTKTFFKVKYFEVSS